MILFSEAGGLRLTDSPHNESPIFAVGFLLSTLGYQSHAMWENRVASLGLNSRQAATLIHVARAEGQSQQQLAQTLRIAPSRIVALVDDLEQRGLLRRRTDRADRRVRTLRLTAQGRAVVRTLAHVTDAHEAWLLAGLDDTERDLLLTLLTKAAKGLDLSETAHAGLGGPEWRRP
jgi:DNA-binding MarR family transcriptional regulator